MGNFANSLGRDELRRTAAHHQGQHCLLRGTEIQQCLQIITYIPSYI